MARLNLHQLFAGTSTVDGFRHGITLTPDRLASLRAAREKIREHLRKGFRALDAAANSDKGKLLRKAFQTEAEAERLTLQPRFRMQGSFSYSTVNEPAHKPPQQVDMDDGVYFPTSILNGVGPTLAADQLFKQVEFILAPLCAREGWTVTRGKPSSCVRVILDRDAHLDLPLYAIPDEQFRHDTSLMKSQDSYLLKSYGVAGQFLDENQAMAFDAEARELDEQRYEALPADRIMLAHRDGTWEVSDPRKLEQWFNKKKKQHGEILRFVCRYLKAWRDHCWPMPKTGPSSICLMACTILAFERSSIPVEQDRDDATLLMVASMLPAILEGQILNPAVDGASNLDSDWEPEKRQEFVSFARDLYENLPAASSGPFHDNAVRLLRDALGERVPDDISLVRTEEEARILSVAPSRVVAPVVARSTSG